MTAVSDQYKLIPSVDSILQQTELVHLQEKVGKAAVKAMIRGRLDRVRQQIAKGDEEIREKLLAPDFVPGLAAAVAVAVEHQFASTLRSVFNLSGTVIHTNLGRARFPPEAVHAMELAATECSNLEFDLTTGKRGDRDYHIEAAVCELCGAEAATVVNNNAAAVLLVLSTLAADREVLISRGELVEIGGSFRIPDVMKSAGCQLKEVGTTNRTHLDDFASAIDNKTALIMKVHTSNYEIRGFTRSVPESDLHELADRHGIPFVSDLGSGTLVDLSRYGLPDEPTVSDELLRGADLVTFSGDKLLGGPQAGIIVGRRDLIQRLKRNPLKRALRIDKVTLAALAEVFQLYRDPDRLGERLPVLRDLTRPLEEIEAMAGKVEAGLKQALADSALVSVEPCKSQIGSGSLPVELLDSVAIVCTPLAQKGKRDAALLALADAFRSLPRPVIGRVHDGRLLLDCRCLRDESGFLSQLSSLAVQSSS